MKRNNKAPRKERTQRQLKAGEVIRRALVDILAREAFRDPVLQDVSVTISEVRASPDFQHAIVFAAPLGGENIEAVIDGLNRCAPFLRGRLGKELTMRSTPTLKFAIDTTFEAASEMQELLARPEILRDLIGDTPDGDEPDA
jgi:ribosome-binding factor A